MLEPIEVMALDENFNRASGGIAYRSLIWKRRYYECGTFELYVPKTIYKPTWKYIYTADRPETGIIETVCATDDVHAWGGVDTVKVSGRFAESLLSRKVLLPSRVTGYGSTGDNVAVSMRWAEEIFGDRFAYLEPDFAGVERAMAPEPAPYGGILYDELKMAEASFRVLYDFVGNVWTLQPWRGLDRTQSQGGGIVPDPEPPVPDEPTIDDLYEPLDYIVSTGEQYIDTGIIPNGSTRVTAKFSLTGETGDFQTIFGSRTTSSGSDQYALKWTPSALWRTDYSTSRTSYTSAIAGMGEHTVDKAGNATTLDGVTVTNSATFAAGSTPMTIFAQSENGTIGEYVKGRLEFFRAYGDGSTLTLDLIPKRRISDGAVGMLDLVNEVFYPSASGVAFLAPGELPAGYTRLEYIESTGSQYIDTGIIPNGNTRVAFSFYPIKTNNTHFFGSRTAMTASDYYLTIHANNGTVRDDYGSHRITSGVTPSGLTVIDKNGAAFSIGEYSAAHTASSFTGTYTLYLFAGNTAGTATLPTQIRGVGCQIYQDGTNLDRDYVPVKNSSGEAGLFDLVTMAFYPDASGTGFVAGPEVTAVAEASTFSLIRTVAASEETTETAAINSFALFSDQMGTIRDYVAVKDSSGYKNACVIGYEFEEPEWNGDSPRIDPLYEWDDSGYVKTLVGWQIPYHITRGYVTARIEDGNPDDETYLDLTSTKPPYDQEWSRSKYPADAEFDFPADMRASYEAFPNSLKAEGLKHLQSNFPYIEEIDTGELASGGYLRRWDLGDKVDALLLDIGIDMEARITGVDEVYEGKTRSVVPIIGEKKHRRI